MTDKKLTDALLILRRYGARIYLLPTGDKVIHVGSSELQAVAETYIGLPKRHKTFWEEEEQQRGRRGERTRTAGPSEFVTTKRCGCQRETRDGDTVIILKGEKHE